MLISVQECIGCGAISTPQPCLGTCVDRRLELVRAGEHAAAVTALAGLERSCDDLRTLVERLARVAPAEDEWEPLRARARGALRGADELSPADVVTAWACDSCGRIEAPQPCIGVCIRPETAMVPAAEHQAVLDRAAVARSERGRLAPPVRQLAWSTPRAGRFQDAARALQAAARAALSE